MVHQIYDYVIAINAPYLNLPEITQIYTDGLFSFFTNDKSESILKVLTHRYSCWIPKDEILTSKFNDLYKENKEIEIEKIFIGYSKTYLRLSSYSLAIINAVIALEIVVPKYIDSYLLGCRVTKEAIQDFDTKFGLSVRVKAILKTIISKERHGIIDEAGSLIKYRNKIMHQGIKNSELQDYHEIERLVVSAEKLIELLENNLNQ